MAQDIGSLWKRLPDGRCGRRHNWGALSLIAAALVGCGATRHGARGDTEGAGAASGSGSGGGESAGAPSKGGSAAAGIALAGDPKYYRFVGLTNSQWAASVQEVLRLSKPSGLEQNFETIFAGTGFSNNELGLGVDPRRWKDFQVAAEALAQQVTASDDALAAVYPNTDVAGFIRTVGRRAYRRPLTDTEISKYTKLFTAGTAMSGTKSTFAKGAALVIRGLLQSPNFLFRTELGPAAKPLSGYEAAAKLSLWLRDSTPDDALLDAAPTLTSADALADEASSMLHEAAATAVMRQFHGELLHFARFRDLTKVGVASYNEALNAEFEESSYRFFDNIFQQGLGLRDILTSTRGFVGPGMAPLYGLQASGSGFVEQELGARRVGFFSQLPFLTLYGLRADPNSFARGASLALDVLCSALGPPNPEIPPFPQRQPGQTNRQRLEGATNSCGSGCHTNIINPLGFAFEHFDGMGQYRDIEPWMTEQLPIDSSGSYTFIDGTVAFADNTELMQAMVKTQDAHLCYSKKLASFGLQRDIVMSDMPWLTQLASVSRDDEGSIQEVILALIKSDAFRTHWEAP